jgi:phage repressor protein C with HTH and peptisase S24 domain
LRAGVFLLFSRGGPARRRDRVVVKTKAGEVMVKELKRKTSKAIELQSLNREHADRTISVPDLLWIARIVWASQ